MNEFTVRALRGQSQRGDFWELVGRIERATGIKSFSLSYLGHDWAEAKGSRRNLLKLADWLLTEGVIDEAARDDAKKQVKESAAFAKEWNKDTRASHGIVKPRRAK